jgi:hypothetical protein
VLYPATSDVMKAKEDYIIRAVGDMSCYQLRQRIRGDLKDLVAYTYVTGLDGSPTLGERARVGWMRLMCRMHVEGKQTIRAGQYLHHGVGFVARSVFVAMLRPFGILLLIVVLLWLSLASLTEQLSLPPALEFLKKGISFW